MVGDKLKKHVVLFLFPVKVGRVSHPPWRFCAPDGHFQALFLCSWVQGLGLKPYKDCDKNAETVD